ncbi:MAG: tRNA uridine-5-carboxymethylaminomethyl(34) synthesis enzyme MnmG, partial [Phycisphaerae bacterium]|nr:tRNA uridine-5-carboxymethylaminomethyl(34) synthesis enzyme MnmG [Phycisphaerae bacterium]NIR47579.1 tRNA uridine-5-carboxymethylaminomethyl(34) synthesis enzyme MnmG [candidate division KSB1 bacterium]NIS23141.1 tRNA uridine-5-carboxymethylaminomethyl(34) synthesis enzyme MnmG [candidate division KSB1 bacterium]NIU23639.1 tRNA uridine-5-carboxymethylaminomethyl(34) synthesis enzyme MnmG [candidate division KSB1 bacterium]NIV01799.1 tRNA uridine-5-carboxymethylaminomethyl(34) synthesis enzy
MREAQRRVFAQANLSVIAGSVVGLMQDKGEISAAVLEDGSRILCRSLILTCGTFLNGRIHIGLNNLESGRAGEQAIKGLTGNLKDIGFHTGRLKTGTPPRVHRDSIDFSKVQVQEPDDPPIPFSFEREKIEREQLRCYITYTNTNTHDWLRTGLDRSPMYTGVIKATGARYCPSIEDKIVRFADKDRHQIFLEPEGFDNPEVYVNGFSTSLPEDVQEKAIRTVVGLENAQIIRLGYAVEYDFFPSYQLQATLETKLVENLYFAGQINGTSGYEEAAAQGLLAGINAAMKLLDREPLTLDRSEAYAGVLVDDLINKTILEPYRMFTSRAEFRLLLRHDNADLRLMEHGHRIGLIGDATYERMVERREEIAALKEKIGSTTMPPETFNAYAEEMNSSKITQAVPLQQLIKRPEVKLEEIISRSENFASEEYSVATRTEVDFSIKYEGFLKRQQDLVDKFKKMENTKIPDWIDYDAIGSLSTEGREKLKQVRPHSMGQAARISGVRQGDISILMVYLEKGNRERKIVSRETVA